MSITEMARSLTAVAKTGAKTNIENEKVSRLALLLAKGNFNILSVEDRYGVVSLHTVTKGIPSVLTSRSIVKAKEEGRILSDWEDYLIDEKSEFYTTEW